MDNCFQYEGMKYGSDATISMFDQQEIEMLRLYSDRIDNVDVRG